MSDLSKSVLIAGGIVLALWLVTHTYNSQRRVASPWQSIPANKEPVGTGNNWNPAFVSTAATSDPLVTGEPEDGNIVAHAICAAHAKIGTGN